MRRVFQNDKEPCHFEKVGRWITFCLLPCNVLFYSDILYMGEVWLDFGIYVVK